MIKIYELLYGLYYSHAEKKYSEKMVLHLYICLCMTVDTCIQLGSIYLLVDTYWMKESSGFLISNIEKLIAISGIIFIFFLFFSFLRFGRKNMLRLQVYISLISM